MSIVDKEKAKGCDYCGGKGLVSGYGERPCPYCQRQSYDPYTPTVDLQRAIDLRGLIAKVTDQLSALKYDLQKIEEKCGHKEWSEPIRLTERIYDMETNVKWNRSCKGCGLVQSTSRVREKKIEEPVF